MASEKSQCIVSQMIENVDFTFTCINKSICVEYIVCIHSTY